MHAVVGAVSLLGTLLAVAAHAQTAPAAESPPPQSYFPVIKILPATMPPKSEGQKYKTEIGCRTMMEVGSLITKRKSCLTRKQWDYVDQDHRDQARKMMMDNMGSPH
jgi:hypothetical protein